MQDTKRHPIRFAIPVLLGIALTGCALDPVNLVLQANSALYTPPPPDPFGGLTRESTGATPGHYRKLGCIELATELENQTKVLSLISASDSTGRTMQHWHIDAIETVQKEKQCSFSTNKKAPEKTSENLNSIKTENSIETNSNNTSAALVSKSQLIPYCYGSMWTLKGNSPRPLITPPVPSPNVDTDPAVMTNILERFISHVHNVQPGVWGKDMKVVQCQFGGLCGASTRPSGRMDTAMLLCEQSKERATQTFENLKEHLSSPQVIGWNP